MRSFSTFRTDLGGADIARAEAARLRSLATWAYLLVRPGMEFVRQRSNFILGWQAAARQGAAVSGGVSAGAVGRAGVPALGSWMILPELASPATRTVLPSNDALYGASHVELGLVGPVVLSVPANVDERYFSVAVMDAHMNNVLHLGPRWTGQGEVHAVVAPPGWAGTVPDGMSLTHSSTPSICLYNRMLVEAVEGDLDRVRRWQAGLRIIELARWGTPDPTPSEVEVDGFLHPHLNTLTDPVEYLAIGLEHLRRNPLVPAAGWLSDLVLSAGFLDAAANPDLRQAIAAGVGDATAMLDAALTTWPRVRGWMVPDPRLGLPNPQVLRAAAFQQFQIGSNDISESAYYFTDTEAGGAVLDGGAGRRYRLTFPAGQVPPLHPGGYWSLTMYNADSLLVANPIQRHAIRPTSPGLEFQADGGVSIELAHELPGDAAPANWLPAPDGPFRLGLRAYYPRAEIADGSWMPPAVERVS
jgi:hypothetical protein